MYHLMIFVCFLTNLWCKLHLQLPGQILSLKLCILSDI